MSTIKSSNEHLTFNADGSGKEVRFQANGTQKASISSAGVFTSTAIDATVLTGNLPALSAAALTSIPAGNLTGTVADARISALTASKLTGTVADARISALTASKLTGALPAISAANLTAIPAANITGTLPAISGANLTGLVSTIAGATDATVSTSDPDIDSNPSATGHIWINKTSGETYVCTNITTDENIWVNIGEGAGGFEPMSWGGDRALFAGGTAAAADTDSIDYVNFAGSNADAADFGNLEAVRLSIAGLSNKTRGVFGAGNPSYVNTMQYVTIATTGNTTDFGDMTRRSAGPGALCDGTRGVWAGAQGVGISHSNEMEYITVATTGNGTDFGDLQAACGGPRGSCNGIRGLWWAGSESGAGNTNRIQYITVATTGNATDFGDMVDIKRNHGACGNADRALSGGGFTSALLNVIEYVNPASTGNSTDFGDLTDARYMLEATANSTRALFGGGYGSVAKSPVMDYVTIATTGNATDFGDLLVGRYSHAQVSGG